DQLQPSGRGAIIPLAWGSTSAAIQKMCGDGTDLETHGKKHLEMPIDPLAVRLNAHDRYSARLGRVYRGDLSESLGVDRECVWGRSEEHTSELQSRGHLVCRLLLEKKNTDEIQKRRI